MEITSLTCGACAGCSFCFFDKSIGAETHTCVRINNCPSENAVQLHPFGQANRLALGLDNLSLTESWKEPEVSGIEGLDQLTQRDSASINRSEEMETLLQLCEHRHVVVAILLLPWVEVRIAIFTGGEPPCLVVWRPHILCVISARIFVVVVPICTLP